MYSQSHDIVEHIAKLKRSSPWASALVISFDFRGSTNDQPRPRQLYLWSQRRFVRVQAKPIFWDFRFITLKILYPQIILECHTTYCSIHNGTKVIALHMLRQQICLDIKTSCFYDFNKISDKRLFNRIWLQRKVTWMHIWIKEVYGNYIIFEVLIKNLPSQTWIQYSSHTICTTRDIVMEKTLFISTLYSNRNN